MPWRGSGAFWFGGFRRNRGENALLPLARVQWERGLAFGVGVKIPSPQPLSRARARGLNPVVIPQFLGEKCMLPLARVQWERGLGVRDHGCESNVPVHSIIMIGVV